MQEYLFQRRFDSWLQQFYTLETEEVAEQLPVRRDMVTLLQYVRDNKVYGTQSTGNMQLKYIREVTARFVNPPQLDTSIGDRVYRLRTEYNVWPLYFLHVLANMGVLLQTLPGRRWRLLPYGERFLQLPPTIQVVYMLLIWWYRVNWLIAYPFAGMGDQLPSSFYTIALTRLRSLPTETTIPFREFAGRLIADTGLKWHAEVEPKDILYHAVEKMVIRILHNFGAVTRVDKHRDDRLYPYLDSFQITPFGRALLEAMATLA